MGSSDESVQWKSKKDSIMKVLTWNINGIRGNKGLPLKQLLDSLDADIICLQETKVTREQLDESTAIVEGYNSYFSFSRARSGYSGVATFARDGSTPYKAEDGLSGLGQEQRKDQSIGNYDSSEFTDEELVALDREGRSIMTQHRIRDSAGTERDIVIINVYCPRAEIDNQDRKTFKMQFYQLLQARAEAILKSGRHVIVLGDINTSHKKIDHCDPANDEEFYANPGRKWLDTFLLDPVSTVATDIQPDPDEHHQFIDTFRLFHPDHQEAFTNWSSATGARETNYGCRLDYIFADKFLARHVFRKCSIMPEVLGSDHCPVKAVLDCSGVAAKKCPPLCTKYMPQFAGRQQKLSMFLVKASKPQLSSTVAESVKDSQQQSSDCDHSEASEECLQEDINLCSETSGSKVSSNVTQNTEDSQLSQLTTSLSWPTSTDVLSSGHSSVDSISVLKEERHPTSLKRAVSGSKKSDAKKSKVESKNDGKQRNLLNFFGKRIGSQLSDTRPSDTQLSDTDSNVLGDQKRSCDSLSGDYKLADTNKLLPFHESDLYALPSNKCGEVTELRPSCELDDTGDAGKELAEVTNHNASTWKSLLKGPPQAPLCKGHNEPCVLRTVKKSGPNKGRQFWTCNRPEGHKTNREARCQYFVWVSHKK